MPEIRFLVMDVDGTMTDGKIYMGQEGENAKAFDIKDGAGIFLVLPGLNIVPVIITARESRILENRCKELNITELHQNARDKLRTLEAVLEKYGAGLESVAYAGDPLPDLPCMEAVKRSGGLVLCPADAIPEIKAIADHISRCRAGEGAIRDCIHYLAQKEAQSAGLQKRIENAVSFILSGTYADRPSGSLPDGTPYTIQEYMTKKEDSCVLESHRFHVDIQYMISGNERFKLYSDHCLTGAGAYNADGDTELWEDGIVSSCSLLVPGSIIVVKNNQAHKGAIQAGMPERVRKLVCKLSVE